MFPRTECHGRVDDDSRRWGELLSEPRRRHDKTADLMCTNIRTPLAPVHRWNVAHAHDGNGVRSLHRGDDSSRVYVRWEVRHQRIAIFVDSLRSGFEQRRGYRIAISATLDSNRAPRLGHAPSDSFTLDQKPRSRFVGATGRSS